MLKKYFIIARNIIINNKILFNNFSNLTLFQLLSILLPLITYPYLIRILGKETFGLIVFAQSITQYFIMFINYGFNIYSTQTIAINANNDIKKSEIVSSTLIIKSFLFLIAILVMYYLTMTIPFLNKEAKLYMFSMALCLQELLFPTWFFLGIEKMKYITRINLISRTIFTLLIFIFIKNKSDYLLVPLLNAFGGFIAGIYALYIMFYEIKIYFKIQKFEILLSHFRNSSYYFVSNISIVIYSNAGNFILGLTGNMSQVAYYDMGQKILGLIKSFISIIEQTIFPRLTKTKDLIFFKKTLKITFLFVFLICVFILIFSADIIRIVAGVGMDSALIPFKIMVLGSIPIVFSTFYGHIMLLVWDRKKDFLMLRLVSLFSYIILLYLGFVFFKINAISIALIFLINELFIVMFTFLISRHIFYASK